jgi:predicted acylesterase/phospholipase RssA
MARIALWALGGVPWKPRIPTEQTSSSAASENLTASTSVGGPRESLSTVYKAYAKPRGLRILCLDGGGTRGVLSVAMLQELFQHIYLSDSSHKHKPSTPKRFIEPWEVFDLICGTSTGGILAVLLGGHRCSLAETARLYDTFIGNIFATKSNYKLVVERALYNELNYEQIIYNLCGDRLMLDYNEIDNPRIFCVATQANVNHAQPVVFRNYNYPPGTSFPNPFPGSIASLT